MYAESVLSLSSSSASFTFLGSATLIADIFEHTTDLGTRSGPECAN